MADWQSRWRAIVASDVSDRDGIGWEFTSKTEAVAGIWAVFREDGGPFPVFSSSRAPGPLPSQSDLYSMTSTAVDDLLLPLASLTVPVGYSATSRRDCSWHHGM